MPFLIFLLNSLSTTAIINNCNNISISISSSVSFFLYRMLFAYHLSLPVLLTFLAILSLTRFNSTLKWMMLDPEVSSLCLQTVALKCIPPLTPSPLTDTDVRSKNLVASLEFGSVLFCSLLLPSFPSPFTFIDRMNSFIYIGSLPSTSVWILLLLCPQKNFLLYSPLLTEEESHFSSNSGSPCLSAQVY